MNLALSNGETVLKSWDYGKLKGGFFTKGTYSLTVTNKKLIASYESKQESFREDFDLSSVNGLSVSFKIKKRFLIFKRGSLSVSVYSPANTVDLVGISAIRAGGSLLSRLPIIGGLFGGARKIKVDVNCAKEIANTLSTLVFKSSEPQV